MTDINPEMYEMGDVVPVKLELMKEVTAAPIVDGAPEQTPVLLDPNRNLRKLGGRLAQYGRYEVEPETNEKILALAKRVFFTRMVQIGKANPEDKSVLWRITDDEIVHAAGRIALRWELDQRNAAHNVKVKQELNK